jgi:hypothetical protein
MTETNEALLEGGGMQGSPSLLEISQASLAGPSDRASMNMKTHIGAKFVIWKDYLMVCKARR